jgi:hypothetical protein
MSALKRKSSVALIIGIIMVLLLIPAWCMTLAPFLMVSELEKIDVLYVYEGTLEFLGHPSPILFDAHLYVETVKEDNATLRIDVNVITGPSGLSRNSTYVFNKFTRENVRDAPEADKPREGYDPLFPSHLKADEDIPMAWLDNLNTTATLEFKESVKEEGVTLYKYFVNKTIIDPDYYLGPPVGYGNCSLMSTKTILIEPLSGLWIYTEDEKFSVTTENGAVLTVLTWNSTAESKAEKLAEAKAVYGSIQLLEVYVPAILGVAIIILTIALAYNIRRLKTKKPQKPTPQSPASR